MLLFQYNARGDHDESRRRTGMISMQRMYYMHTMQATKKEILPKL